MASNYTPTFNYDYDEDGVIVTGGGCRDDGSPYVPTIPPGYGKATYSVTGCYWYAPRVDSRHVKKPRTASLYSPAGHDIRVARNVLDDCVAAQGGRCIVTGRKFDSHHPPALVRHDVTAPCTMSNMAAVESWMLDGDDPVTVDILVQQWATRPQRRRSIGGRVSGLPF